MKPVPHRNNRQRSVVALLFTASCWVACALVACVCAPEAVAETLLDGTEIVPLSAFPDERFRAFLREQLPVQSGYEDEYGVYHDEPYLLLEDMLNRTRFDCSGRGIASLEGIERFQRLTMLLCANNSLTSLDVSGLNSLKSLSCDGNRLTSLDVSGLTRLEALYCGNNELTTLDVSGLTGLAALHCSDNQLVSLNVSGLTALMTLYCYNNQLAALDVSGLMMLKELDCWKNRIESLDVSGLTRLTTLYCNDNRLVSLCVNSATSLQTLHCWNNDLTSLDVSGLTRLTALSCQNNPLVKLSIPESVAALNYTAVSSPPMKIALRHMEGGRVMFNIADIEGMTAADIARFFPQGELPARMDAQTGDVSYPGVPNAIAYRYAIRAGAGAAGEYLDVTLGAYLRDSALALVDPSAGDTPGIDGFTQVLGAFSWEKADVEDADFTRVALRLMVGGAEAEGLRGVTLTVPDGFSFSAQDVQTQTTVAGSGDYDVYPLTRNDAPTSLLWTATLHGDTDRTITLHVPVTRVQLFALPSGMIGIEAGAFAGCAFLQAMLIPAGVRHIAPDALPSKNVVLYVEKGSYGHQFAKENGYPYRFAP